MNDKLRASEELRPVPELPIEFCPVCAAHLEPRHCKMICGQCGFFLSCSDFH